MKFGLHLPNFGAVGDPRVVQRLAADAEEAGWDGFFLWDHILGDASWRTPMIDALTTVAAVAASTHGIRIGALVTAVPRRRPWQLARELTTLDHLSNGRLVVGVGLGHPAEAEFTHFGEEAGLRDRARRLDEGLSIINGLWSGEPFSHAGEAYQLGESVFLPAPVQQPRPPIWVAAHWPNRAPLRRAARWDGVFPEHGDGRRLSPQELRELMAYVHEHRRPDAGAFDIVVAGHAQELTGGELVQYAAAGVTWWLESISPDLSLADVQKRVDAGPQLKESRGF